MGSSCTYKSSTLVIHPIHSSANKSKSQTQIISNQKSQVLINTNPEKDPQSLLKIIWEKKEKEKSEQSKNEKRIIEKKSPKKIESCSVKQKMNGKKSSFYPKIDKNYRDPKTCRIVPNLKPLASNKLYVKRVILGEEEFETDVDVSMKIKRI